MTFQKPKFQTPKQPGTEKQKNDVMDANIEALQKGYERVSSTFDKFLESSITYSYYILSIDAACIGFTVSLTVHEKFSKIDSVLMISFFCG